MSPFHLHLFLVLALRKKNFESLTRLKIFWRGGITFNVSPKFVDEKNLTMELVFRHKSYGKWGP